MSPGKFSAASGAAAPRSPRSEVLSYRQHFALTWQRFIQRNFETPVHAADFFKVDATTAEKWWRGLNAPSGWVVGRAISDPETRDSALDMLTRAA